MQKRQFAKRSRLGANDGDQKALGFSRPTIHEKKPELHQQSGFEND
jgi:hypothetical protein